MTLNEFLFRDNALTILPSTWHLISSHLIQILANNIALLMFCGVEIHTQMRLKGKREQLLRHDRVSRC